MKRRVPAARPEYLQFLSPFGSRITELALATRAMVLGEAPAAMELIYDAYNAVATGFSFTGRPSDCFIHVAVYAKWVNVGFNQGSQFEDPDGILQGSGRWIRHIRISEPADLKDPRLRGFVRSAIARADRPEAGAKGVPASKSVVRAIYPKKRRPNR